MMMQLERIAASWLRTRRAMSLTPQDLAEHRRRLWADLQPALARTPALAPFAGAPLEAFPVTPVHSMRQDYGAWNSLSLSDEALRRLADAAEMEPQTTGLSAGWSTGSSGATRGLFVATAAERADYIGQSLARLLPFSALLRSQRLALQLRASNALYSDAARRRLRFAHFPIELAVCDSAKALQDYAPTILIAPPSRLIGLACLGATLPTLRHLFFGSEPMSSVERDLVTAHFGIRPRSIWQATEGFLGAECAAGRLHLNDHALEIEPEPVTGTRGFRPVITDLRRHSQPIVRIIGDDYVEWGEQNCPCGFAGRVIRPVEGRVQDIWRFDAHCITPPQVIAAVESVLTPQHQWQASADRHGISLAVGSLCPPDRAAQAATVLERLVGRKPVVRHDLPDWHGPKRRKVVWRDG